MKKLLLSYFILLSSPAWSQENPNNQKYFNWHDAMQAEGNAYKAADADLEKCSEGVLDDQGRIPREKAVFHQNCINHIIGKQVLPYAMFPDLVVKLHDEKLLIARNYQDGKIERDEANQKSEKTKADFWEATKKRSLDAQVAEQHLECSALYYDLADRFEMQNSSWAERFKMQASKGTLTSLTRIRGVFISEQDAEYLGGASFLSDFRNRIKERQGYWDNEIRNESAIFGNQLNICKDLLSEQDDFFKFLRGLINADEI